MTFLIAGHTHEDIDQMFSTFAKWLTKNYCNLATPDDFIKKLKTWYTTASTRPEGKWLRCVWDFKSYFAQHMHALQVNPSLYIYAILGF